MEFLILRYSLVEEQQDVINKVEPLPIPKGKAIMTVFNNGDREFTNNKVEYAFVGFSLVNSTNTYSFPKERYLVGKLAKLRKAHVGKKIPGDIVKHKEDDWIPLITIFDLEKQYILVQKETKFGDESQITNTIQAGLRELIRYL